MAIIGASPYNLRVYAVNTDGFSADFGSKATVDNSAGQYEADITRDALHWSRVETFQLGYYTGAAMLTGEPAQLWDRFSNWLGYRIEERAPGIAWEGQIWTMTLFNKGVVREISLDDMANAVKAEYREHLDNTDFEDWSGGLPVGWARTIGSNTTEETTAADVARGSSSVLVGTGSNLNQDVGVEPMAEYRATVYARLSAGTVKFQVYDNTGAQLIHEVTVDNTDRYVRYEINFTTPASCVSVRVNFDCTSGLSSGYFDTASLVRIIDGRPGDARTDWYENERSIARFGRKELVLTGFESSAAAELAADNTMKRIGWPQPRPPSFDPQRGDFVGLSLGCQGFALSMLNQYIDPDDIGVTESANAFATRAIGAKAKQISLINSDSAITTKIRVKTDTFERLYDVMARLVAAAKADEIVRFRVGPRRMAELVVEKKTPTLFIRNGKIYSSAGASSEVNARMIRPGVALDMDLKPNNRATLSTSLFTDPRTVILDGIEVDETGQYRIVRGSNFGRRGAALR